MTKFDLYVERTELRRKLERENALNETLLRGLQTRTREESLTSLFNELVIPLGVKSIVF